MNSRSIYSRISLILVATVLLGTSSVAIPRSVGYSDTPKTYNSKSDHWYQRIDTPMGWHAARDYCTAFGAHLATIGSASEDAFVYNLEPYGWLGGTDEIEEGVWKWVTGEPWVFSNWAPGEPNNAGGNEHYLSRWNDPYEGQWNDAPDDMKAFVCEWETPCTNVVPLSKQCAEPWSGDPYDHIEATICDKGCALTSAVMILNYYGVQTSPRDLNTWLKERFIDRNQNGAWDPGEPPYGYDSGGNVIWQAVAQYSQGVISYYGWAPADDSNSTLNGDLCKGRPVILAVPGHFIVTTGQTRVDEALTWSINDPGYDRTTLLDYGNNYSSMRRFGPRRADNSALVVRAHSPVEIFVTDPQGRSLGIDPETGWEIQEIPDANYYHEESISGAPETKVIEILSPAGGSYTIKVVGTDTGSYTLDYEGYFESGRLGSLQVVTGQIASGVVHEYEINYTPVPYKVFLPIVTANR